jgi:hypothetical protein
VKKSAHSCNQSRLIAEQISSGKFLNLWHKLGAISRRIAAYDHKVQISTQTVEIADKNGSRAETQRPCVVRHGLRLEERKYGKNLD